MRMTYALLTFQLIIGQVSYAQSDTTALQKSRFLIQRLKEQYPALSVSVAINGKMVWNEAFGVTSLLNNQPAETSDQFRLYSLSKSITGLLVAILEDEGKINLQNEIGTYDQSLPEHLKNLKVYQLLSHTAGIRHYKDGEWIKISKQHCQTTREAILQFQNDKLADEPGEKYAYSSFGFVLLAHVIESATHQSYNDLVEEKIFKPAGASLFSDNGDASQSRLTFYERKGKKMKEAMPVDNSCKFGGGNFNGTAENFTTIFSTVVSSEKIVKASTWKRMLTKFALSNGSAINYSYGLQRVTSAEGWDLAVHTGSGMGGSSVLCIAPEYGIVITLVTNVDDDEFYKHGIQITKKFIREQITQSN